MLEELLLAIKEKSLFQLCYYELWLLFVINN